MDPIRKYLALIFVILIGVILAYLLFPFIAPILISAILAFLLYPIHKKISSKVKNESVSATIIIVLLLLIIFIPLTSMAGLLINQISKFDLGEETVLEYEQRLFDTFGVYFPILDLIERGQEILTQNIADYTRSIVSLTVQVVLFFFIMLFFLYYFLIQKTKFLELTYSLLPFSRRHSKKLVDDSGKVTKAILVGIILTAIIQGLLGMFSFFVAGINGAFFWGIVMIILAIIPVVGAFLVWVPAGLFLVIEGNIGMGLFVLLWGVFVVSPIDNILRPKLVSKFADIHPLETFIGIIVGIAAFDMIGLILGPLLFSFFKIFLRTFKLEYGDELNGDHHHDKKV